MRLVDPATASRQVAAARPLTDPHLTIPDYEQSLNPRFRVASAIGCYSPPIDQGRGAPIIRYGNAAGPLRERTNP